MPTVFDNYANNCTGTVITGQLNNTNNPVIFSVGPSDLLDPGGNAIQGPFTATVWDSGTYGSNPDADPQMEIIWVQSNVSSLLTAIRGQENTANVAHSGTTLTIAVNLTAGILDLILNNLSDIPNGAPPMSEPFVTDFPTSTGNYFQGLMWNGAIRQDIARRYT